MEATEAPAQRPAADIASDIGALIRSFPPLDQSRHWFSYEVNEDGTVILQGNIKSPVGHRVLMDNVKNIPGVTGVDMSALHDDEVIRRTIMTKGDVPLGVWVVVNYGSVALTGTLPPRHKAEALVKRVEKVKGVRQVINQLQE